MDSKVNEMLNSFQHDKKKCVIPNLFRNLDFDNDNKSTAFVLVRNKELSGGNNFKIYMKT